MKSLTHRAHRAKLLSLAVALCLLLMTGCDTYDNFLSEFFDKSNGKDTAVKIGVFEPLTGSDAQGAKAEIRGIELAHELYPDVLGMPVKLVYGDNQSDVSAAVAAAQSLVDQDVSVVLGSYKSVLTLAASDVFAEARIPAIGITCTNPLITKTNDFYYRVCFVDAFQGNSAAKYVTEHLNLESAVAFKKQGDDYAGAMIDEFIDKMVRQTGEPECVTLIEYPEDTKDFTPFFERIRQAGSPAVFFPSEAALADEVLYQAYEGRYKFLWIGNEKWEDLPAVNINPYRDSALYIDGVAFVAEFDDAARLSDMTEIFLEAYAEKYGEDEKPDDATALGFDAYLLALRGIEDAGTHRNGSLIASKLSSVFEMPAATGSITLNAQGDPIKEVVIERFLKTEPKPVFTAIPTWGQ